MNKLQIFLLVLIVLGLGLLATKNIWVPKLVEKILSSQESLITSEATSRPEKEDSDESQTPAVESDIRVLSPEGKYYAVERYIKSEWVTCCGNDEPFEKKFYSVSIYEENTNKSIKEFTEFNIGNFQGYTPRINKWYSPDILQMSGEGVIDGFDVYYNISEDKLIPDWEFAR